MTTSIVIHGHFYQPPREDPWLEEIIAEPSAAPYHDWNQLIERDCYRAVVAARLYGPDGRIARIENLLESISFNVGPTLLEWLESHAHDTYEAILAADRRSVERLGHGNAIAMPYHHSILPLSNRRDKTTEVRWGVANFRHRFGRDPEGMWLPETAVDHETLDVLAAEGIRFTVLGSHQVVRPPAGGWAAGMPGRYRSSEGRELAVFVYDGALSHEVAFGPLLKDAGAWAERMVAKPGGGEGGGGRGGGEALVSIATDGETYGHHHTFGEMALAALLDDLSGRPDVTIENYASFLARYPPTEDIELVSPSSWSCAHGVERWRADCGCKMKPAETSQQGWRAALRSGVDWLAEELHQIYEHEAGREFGDPWDVRDRYGKAVSGEVGVEQFLDGVLRNPADGLRRVRALELLEMERDALRIFTSCGWFFDDIAGIEALQVLRYAAHGIELAGVAHAGRLEGGFLEHLGRARSNDATQGTGRDIYLSRVKPDLPAAARVAAGHVAALAAGARPLMAQVRAYDAVASGDRVTITHRPTGRREEYQVRVDVENAEPMTVTVTGNDAPEFRLTLDDLAEPHRRIVASTRRAVLAVRWLTEDERALVGRGDTRLEGVVRHALVAAIDELGNEDLAQRLDRAGGLLELLGLCGVKIPFDAQTRFARRWSALSPAARQEAQAFGRRLGLALGETP